MNQKFNKLNRFSPSYRYYQRRFQSGLGLDFVTFYSSQQKQEITISDKPQDKHLCLQDTQCVIHTVIEIIVTRICYTNILTSMIDSTLNYSS